MNGIKNLKKAAYRFDSAGSSLGDDVLEIEDDDPHDDVFITFKTTETRCEELYDRGVELKSQKEPEDALLCFLECLKGMQECQYFAKLPQTLHELAEVYRSLSRFDEAVEFSQAEKLFYEVVIADLRNAKEGGASRISTGSKLRDDPAEYGDLLIRKADEFEHLARVSAKEEKFSLALDYCAKAVKIRQSVFGPEHLVTTATLEYFTVLYAEVGRAEYAVAVQHLQTLPECDTPLHNKSASVCMEQRKDSLPSQPGQKVQECHDSSCETLPSTDKEGNYQWNCKLSCGGQSSSTGQEDQEMESHADTTSVSSTTTTSGVVRVFKSTPLWLLLVALIIQVLLFTFLF